MTLILAAAITLPSPGVALLQPPIDEAVRQLVRLTPEPGQATVSSTAIAPVRVFRGYVEDWRGLVESFFGDETDTALCLMGYESEGNPNAYNRSSGASGLMQVLASWAPKFGYQPGDLFDPAVNLKIAAALYANGGWGHWSPWNRGLCR